jgi:hypothetical protein
VHNLAAIAAVRREGIAQQLTRAQFAGMRIKYRSLAHLMLLSSMFPRYTAANGSPIKTIPFPGVTP